MSLYQVIVTFILLTTVSHSCASSPLDYLNAPASSYSNKEYEIIRKKVEESQTCNSEFFSSLEQSTVDPNEIALKDVAYELSEITKPTDTCTNNLLLHYFGILHHVFGDAEALLAKPSHDQKLFECLKDFGRQMFTTCANNLRIPEGQSNHANDVFGPVFGTSLKSLQAINLHDDTTFNARQLSEKVKSIDGRYREIKSEARLVKYLEEKCPILTTPSRDIINIYNMARLLNPESVTVSTNIELFNEYYRICLFYVKPDFRDETINTIKRAMKAQWRNKLRL